GPRLWDGPGAGAGHRRRSRPERAVDRRASRIPAIAGRGWLGSRGPRAWVGDEPSGPVLSRLASVTGVVLGLWYVAGGCRRRVRSIRLQRPLVAGAQGHDERSGVTCAAWPAGGRPAEQGQPRRAVQPRADRLREVVRRRARARA